MSDSSPACLVTPQAFPAFVLPAAVELSSGSFWYGSNELWTQLRIDGAWHQLREADKSFWWSEGFDWRTEPQPALLNPGGGSTVTQVHRWPLGPLMR